MTFKLTDVRPKSGTTVNLKPYAGFSIGRRTWKPTSVITRRQNAKAIESLKRYVAQ